MKDLLVRIRQQWIGLILMLLSVVPIWLARPRSNGLLLDTDTAFLLQQLDRIRNPWYWFTHDWPLQNHFYRPISTLFFEWDHALHRGSGAGFGMTQAALCMATTLAVGWLGAEVMKSITKGAAAAWVFSFWTKGSYLAQNFLEVVHLFLVLVLVAGAILRMNHDWKANFSRILLALSALFIGGWIVAPNIKFASDTLQWLPGRTATSMTLFAVISLASYLRFARATSEQKAEPEPTATDLPATRTTGLAKELAQSPWASWAWFVLSLLMCVLALGSYEQAVMLPFILILLGFWLRTDRLDPRFAFQLPYWFLLIGYVIVRLQFVPLAPSGYQRQQFRDGPGVFLDLMTYGFPAVFSAVSIGSTLSIGWTVLLTGTIYSALWGILKNVAFWLGFRSNWKRPLMLMIMAMLAFLPMAFLKQFGHYHYWPSTFLAIFVIVSLESLWSSWVISVSPQALQAPKRLRPAPGSLPRL